MDLPRLLIESVARYGPPERAAWLTQLPELAADIAERWELRLGRAFQPGGMTSWVAPARRGAHPVVLKLTWHGGDRDESRDEADGLQAWAGGGTVRLLARERRAATTALLLEACEPGTPLDRRPEPEQDVVISRLLRRMWIAPPAGHSFRQLADMCAWWADEAQAKGVRDPGLARAGLGLFRTLPVDPPTRTLLATDLHAGNVLAARREPWLAIDPKPYVGDPHYDALQHLLNCTARLRRDPVGLVRRMADLLDLDAERLRLWLFARCVQESPDDPQFEAIARRIAP